MQDKRSHISDSKKSIDIIEILKVLWTNRKIVIKFSSIFLLIGVLFALTSPIIYVSETTFIPQVSEKSVTNNRDIGALASLAGININQVSQSNDLYISPYLYPKIVESEEFSMKLINEKLVLNNGKEKTLKEYLTIDNKSFNVFNFIRKENSENTQIDKILKDYNYIKPSDYKYIEIFKQKFSIELNEKVGYIKVMGVDKDPLISTQIAELVTKNLQSIIISIRTNKIKDQLDFSQEEYLKQKKVFEKIQNDLAEFNDSNKNISTAVFLSERQKLESEFQLQQNILLNLATEYNNNKIKLNKDTPIFSVIDEVSIPNTKSEPKRILIILIFLFVGIISSSLYVIFKNPFKKIMNYIKSN